MAGLSSSMTAVCRLLFRRPGSNRRSDIGTCTSISHQSCPPTCRCWPHFHDTNRKCVCVCVYVCIMLFSSSYSIQAAFFFAPNRFLSSLLHCHFLSLIHADASVSPDIRRLLLIATACFHPFFSTIVPDTCQPPGSLASGCLIPATA